MMKAWGDKKGNREWETRGQEDKGTRGRKFLIPLSPLLLVPLSPTPHSLLALFVPFAFFASALARDRPTSPPLARRETPPASSPASSPTLSLNSSKAGGSGDRSFRLTLPHLSDAGLAARLESGQAPMTPDESRREAKKRW